MRMDIEILVRDLLTQMLENGIRTHANYTFDSCGNVVSFEIKILGYND
jgi:hypothetical protein